MTRMTELRLHAVLQPTGPAGAIVLDDDQVSILNTAKAFPVVVTVGDRTARLRLARMGGRNLIGFSKAVRAELGVELGDEFDAIIAADAAERTVEIPHALAAALASDPAAKSAYDALSFTRRKEIARSIAEAKQDATRERRIAKALEELRA
jgi:hypothetical protein